jgi:hypothetical protein
VCTCRTSIITIIVTVIIVTIIIIIIITGKPLENILLQRLSRTGEDNVKHAFRGTGFENMERITWLAIFSTKGIL